MVTVTGVNPMARFGELQIDDDNITSFLEKPQTSCDSGLISGGFFVFNREIFNYLSEDENCDLEYGVLEQLAKEGQLKVYKHKGFWFCMDTLRDMDALNEMWKDNRAEWKIW